MERIAAILFDWDGTLLDSYNSGYQATVAVFHHFGVHVDRERYLATYNPNWYETYRSFGLPPEEWEAADRIWLDNYDLETSELYPFAHRTLEILHSRGYRLGLVTSGNKERVTRELERHALETDFSVQVFLEDTIEKKPHPRPLLTALERMNLTAPEAAYVGDRPEDILMGNEAGSFTIGVESDYVTRQVLEAAAPDIIFPDAGHLPARFGPRRRD